MVAELKVAFFSFVLLATLLVTVGTSLRDGRATGDVAAGHVANERRDTYDLPRFGCSSTEIVGTATDTSFQSADRHKDVDEPTIVPWSRGRLGYTWHDEMSVPWSVGPPTVLGDGNGSTGGRSSAAQLSDAARPETQIPNTLLLPRHVDGRTGSHDC